MSKEQPEVIDDDVTKVCVLGDWHGNADFAPLALADAAKGGLPDAYLHVGDFGVWPREIDLEDPDSFLAVVEAELERQGRELWFIDGNHEHFELLEQLPLDDRGLGRLSDHVFHIPRGYAWEWGGKTFVGLGGAVSIDRANRMPYVSWFPEEELTGDDVDQALAVESADVLVTHDMLLELLPQMPTLSFGDEIDAAQDRAQRKLREVIEGLEPKLLVHGHYRRAHVRQKGEMAVVGLGADIGTVEDNWAIIDTARV